MFLFNNRSTRIGKQRSDIGSVSDFWPPQLYAYVLFMSLKKDEDVDRPVCAASRSGSIECLVSYYMYVCVDRYNVKLSSQAEGIKKGASAKGRSGRSSGLGRNANGGVKTGGVVSIGRQLISEKKRALMAMVHNT